MLTDTQSAQINATVNYLFNYEEEALASYESTGEDLMEELEERAEALIQEATAYTEREDLGGLTVYFKDNSLVAFYDYEQFKGTVF
jgi:hypothetical protein